MRYEFEGKEVVILGDGDSGMIMVRFVGEKGCFGVYKNQLKVMK